MLGNGGGWAIDGYIRYGRGEKTGRSSDIGRETGVRIKGRGWVCDRRGIWREGIGEEMGVWGCTVEKLLRAELLCVSLLICGRGWEKCKEVLGVAFVVFLFL